MRTLLRFALILLLLPVSSAFAQDITARFYAEKQEYFVGEPIIIVLEVANNASRDVEVGDEHCDWLHPDQFQLVDVPLKKEISLFGCAPWGGWAGSCGSGARKLPASSKLEQRFLLRGQFYSQFDLVQPGTYHVKASRHVRVYGKGLDDVLADIEAQNEFDVVLREPREGELEAAYQRFLPDLHSTDYETQSLAASALTQDPPQFLENVILSLAANRETANQSIDGLKHLGTAAARKKLIEISSTGDESLRQQAIPALGTIGNPEDCDAILSIAALNQQYTQAQAYIAAGRICGEKAVLPLASLLPSADEQLARAIATALGNTASRDAVSPLISLLVSPDAFVRREAIGALFTLIHHGNRPEFNDPIDASQAYSGWRSWWAMNSQTAAIYGPDQCPATSPDR
jgi:HEAT repeat protein